MRFILYILLVSSIFLTGSTAWSDETSHKNKSNNQKMSDHMNDRYQGKPLLRLLELYVLDCIGHLNSKDAENLKKMTPKLSATYNIDGAWQDIIASVMNFPGDMPKQIEFIWIKNQEYAKSNNENLLPDDFAIMFVDQNFNN